MSLDYISREDAEDLLQKTPDNIFLLLDSGQDSNLMRTLYMFENAPEFRTLLPLRDYEEVAFKGPLLVWVQNPSNSSLLSYFMDTANLGILLTSKSELDGITEYCRALFLQKHGERALFLRYYDQRVLLPLYLDMEQSNAKNFFGKTISGIIAVEKIDESQDNHPNIAYYTPEPLGHDEVLAPFVLTSHNLKAMQTIHHERESQILHELMLGTPAYAAMPAEKQREFIKNARRDGSMFGFISLNTQKHFVPLWFAVGQQAGKSADALAFLSTPVNTVNAKISYLLDLKLYESNPYACPVNPVRLLALHDLYHDMSACVMHDGNRKRLDPLDTNDKLPRGHYVTLYKRYEAIGETLVKAVNSLVKRGKYNADQLQVNFYRKENLALEAALVADIRKEMNYD